MWGHSAVHMFALVRSICLLFMENLLFVHAHTTTTNVLAAGALIDIACKHMTYNEMHCSSSASNARMSCDRARATSGVMAHVVVVIVVAVAALETHFICFARTTHNIGTRST